MRYAKLPKKRSQQAEPMFVNGDGSRMTAADIDQVAIGTLRRNGADPAFIFAYEKVGLLAWPMDRCMH